MRLTPAITQVLLMFGLLTSSIFAHADCVDTVPLNAQEKAFYSRANAALISLLRPAPASEKIRTVDASTNPSDIETCKGDKKSGDFVVHVSRKYIWPDPKGNSADTAITLQLAINVTKFDTSDANYIGAYGNPSPEKSAGMKVNNVEWRVLDSGYGVQSQRDSLRASLANSLDRKRLEALPGKPLPTAAESEAYAKKAAPTELVAVAPSVTSTVTSTTTGAGQLKSLDSAISVDSVKSAADSVQKLKGLFGR